MNEGLIPKRYAKALFEYASERGKAESLYRLMGTLENSFRENHELQPTLENPFIDDSQKERLIATAAGAAGNDPVFADFITLLARNKRLDMVRRAAIAYRDIYRQANHISLVTVTAAAPLDPEEEKRLKDLVAKHLDGGTMEYTFAVDPSLIGGFTVGINSERLDASIKNELKQLRLKLLSK